MLHAAVECGELETAPAFPKGLVVQSDKLPACPSDAEVDALLAHPELAWRRTAIHLGVYAGMRSGEIRGLRVSDLDLENGIIHVRVSMSLDV